ncbi:hypothetical protein BH11PSE12_BH11PSE12_00740 [soil metagenome]
MREIIVFAEGPSDEMFIKRVVAPALRPLNLFLKPQTLKTSQEASGGALSFGRLERYARNALRQNKNVVLTTFMDLYGLDTDFPAYVAASNAPDIYTRAKIIEDAMHAAIVGAVGCRPDRFIPHIQPYEFEGLLFSDVNALVTNEPEWQGYLPALQKVRADFETPEHINNSYETKPSKRLEEMLHPKYKKTRHGPLIGESIGLNKIEMECCHFKRWLDHLRALAS